MDCIEIWCTLLCTFLLCPFFEIWRRHMPRMRRLSSVQKYQLQQGTQQGTQQWIVLKSCMLYQAEYLKDPHTLHTRTGM